MVLKNVVLQPLDETRGNARSDKPPGNTSRRSLRINLVSAVGIEQIELSRAFATRIADATTQNIFHLNHIPQPATSGEFARKERYLPMTFYSILFESLEDQIGDGALEAPAFFTDLNCDQFVDAVTAGREEYNLKPFFYACLRRVDAIKYRHDVMQDLENVSLFERVNSFAQQMRELREYLARAQKLYYKEQKQAWFLNAVGIYCEAVNSLAVDLSNANLKSRGFLGFRDYLTSYAHSVGFTSLWSAPFVVDTDQAAVLLSCRMC